MAGASTLTESLWDDQVPMKVTIINMHSKIELEHLLYFFHGTVNHNVSSNNVRLKTRESIEIRIDPDCLVSTGALMYRLAGERVSLSSSLYMIIAWKLEYLKEPLVYVVVVEHASAAMRWDQDTLREYYDRFSGRFRPHADRTKQSWFIQEGASLDVILDAPNHGNYELNIIINDSGDANNYRNQPVWIEPKR
jgi:hypothetical protein